MSIPYHTMSANAVSAQIRSGAISARNVVEALLARVEALNPRLNAFRVITAERACREADCVDAMIASGKDPGPLAGVPFGVKDLFDVQGLPTVAGAKINLDL